LSVHAQEPLLHVQVLQSLGHCVVEEQPGRGVHVFAVPPPSLESGGAASAPPPSGQSFVVQAHAPLSHVQALQSLGHWSVEEQPGRGAQVFALPSDVSVPLAVVPPHAFIMKSAPAANGAIDHVRAHQGLMGEAVASGVPRQKREIGGAPRLATVSTCADG
jgi:hypothetical protein